MQGNGTKVRLLAATVAASLVALGAGSAASANVRIPELGDVGLPVAATPAPAKGLTRHLVRLGSIPACGGDAYVLVTNGRRGIAMC